MARHSGWRWLGLFVAVGAVASEPVDWRPAAPLNPPAAKIGAPVAVVQPRPLPDRLSVDSPKLPMDDPDDDDVVIEKLTVIPRLVSVTTPVPAAIRSQPVARRPILPTPDLDRAQSPYHPVRTEKPRPFIPDDVPAARISPPAK